MDILFISDLHLNPQEAVIADGFLRFLDQHRGQCQALYILGDLFEAWVGDDDDDDFVVAMCQALQVFSAQSPLFVMRGNRDFLFGPGFEQRTGCRLLDDPTVISLQGLTERDSTRQDRTTPGQTLLLMHGDSLCTDDQAYMQFRTLSRQAAWQAEQLSRPLTLRKQFAAHMRAESQRQQANNPDMIGDVVQTDVDRVLTEHDAALLLHGHTHRPYEHQWLLDGQTRKRLVLGDWHREGYVMAIANAQGIQLRHCTL